MYPLYILILVLGFVLGFTELGEPIRSRFGQTGVIVTIAIIVGLLIMFNEWVTHRFIGALFETRSSPRLSSRRRILRIKNLRTKQEKKIDAMDDDTLRQYIEKNPRDATAIEILCERLRTRGDLEGYARERQYFASLKSDLTVAEKSRLYNELADLYLGPLAQPDRAREALQALESEFPRSFQATLARQRLRRIDDERIAD